MDLDTLLENQIGILQSSRSCTCALFLFLPQGVEIGFIFALLAAVSEIQADFFLNCHIWAWYLAIAQSSRTVTYTPFLPRGSKLSLFWLYGQAFPRYGPMGVEIKLIFPLRAAVSEIRADFFKIAIFGHETWPLAKVPEVAHILTVTPGDRNLANFRSTCSGSRNTGRFSKLPYLGMPWNLAIGQSSRTCTFTS